MGYVNENRKANLFRFASAICTNLSSPELNQTLLEAISTGNPTIAAYDPEVEEVFGDQVRLLHHSSVTELTELLNRVLEADTPPKNIPTIDWRFSLQLFAMRYARFYRLVLSHH